MSGAKDIHDLIDLMAKLPGLGPRSARRTVLHMVRKKNYLLAPPDPSQMEQLMDATSYSAKVEGGS